MRDSSDSKSNLQISHFFFWIISVCIIYTISVTILWEDPPRNRATANSRNCGKILANSKSNRFQLVQHQFAHNNIDFISSTIMHCSLLKNVKWHINTAKWFYLYLEVHHRGRNRAGSEFSSTQRFFENFYVSHNFSRKRSELLLIQRSSTNKKFE